MLYGDLVISTSKRCLHVHDHLLWRSCIFSRQAIPHPFANRSSFGRTKPAYHPGFVLLFACVFLLLCPWTCTLPGGAGSFGVSCLNADIVRSVQRKLNKEREHIHPLQLQQGSTVYCQPESSHSLSQATQSPSASAGVTWPSVGASLKEQAKTRRCLRAKPSPPLLVGVLLFVLVLCSQS